MAFQIRRECEEKDVWKISAHALNSKSLIQKIQRESKNSAQFWPICDKYVLIQTFEV